MTESDLAAAVVSWLGADGWDLYQEVTVGTGRRPDIIAVRGRILWAVEVKRALSFAVVEQAAHHPTHLRSVAVPTCESGSNGRRFAEHVCRQNSVGVLSVSWFSASYWTLHVTVPAPLLRLNDRQARQIRAVLRPEHKTAAQAGSRGGGYWTPFRNTMAAVRRFIVAHPGCTLRQIMGTLKDGYGHYSSEASCRSHLPVALDTLAPWCRVEPGRPRRYYGDKAMTEAAGQQIGLLAEPSP